MPSVAEPEFWMSCPVEQGCEVPGQQGGRQPPILGEPGYRTGDGLELVREGI